MRAVIFALAFLTLAAPASAADAPSLTVEQVIQIGNGIAALDGYDKIVKDGASEKSVHVPYQFGGGLRLLLASDLDKARTVIKRYQDAVQALFSAMQKDGKIPDASLAQYTAEQRKMLDQPADVQLARIKADELKLSENPIPSSVLSNLVPILDQ